MSDPLERTVDEIRQTAGNMALGVFFGWMVADKVPTVHWNQERGGDWRAFLECAKSLKAEVIYLNWTPFEEFQVDDAVSELESTITQNDGSELEGAKDRLSKITKFKKKVGLTCVIDLAFVASGVIHIYQKVADWFNEFESLAEELEDKDDEHERTVDKATITKWARLLAQDPKFIFSNSRQREYLLEKIAGNESAKLPLYEVLARADMIFNAEFKQNAEAKLAEEIQKLRQQGLNLGGIAQRIGISRDRVSSLLSAYESQK